MATRPTPPTFAVGNYPAGINPWSGQALRVQPPSPYWTPNTAVAAEELNYEIGDICDYLGLEKPFTTVGISVPGVGWRAQFNLSGVGYVCSGGAWDATNEQWLICGSVSSGLGACDVFGSVGAGDTDYTTSVSDGSGVSVGGIAMSACNDGTYFYMAVKEHSDLSAQIYRCTSGAAWGSAVFSDTTFPYNDLKLLVHGGNVFLFGATTSATDHVVISYESGGTWTRGVAGFACTAPLGVLVADSGTQIVCFGVTTNPSLYIQSSSPTTLWTGEPATFLAATNEYPAGLAWSPADGAFVLISYAGDLKMRTYQSTDGINWTLIGSITPGVAPAGLAATNDGCLAATLQAASGQHQLIYSCDGGSKWHKAPPRLTAVTALTANGIFSSGVQFFAFGTGGGRFSHCAGFTPSLT